jgi:hypothetical protein
MLYAAEARVYVLVMRLEPVSKGRTKHTGGSARRAALHDEMFAIKEISRVPRVERKGPEASERTEHGRGPLPSIA